MAPCRAQRGEREDKICSPPCSITIEGLELSLGLVPEKQTRTKSDYSFVCLFQCRDESKHICKVHLLPMWIQNTSFRWPTVANMWYILHAQYTELDNSIYLTHTIKKWKLKQKHIPLFLLTLPWGTNDWETIYWKWTYQRNQCLQSIASVIWAGRRCILDNIICFFALRAWGQLQPEVEYQARNSP